MRGLVVLLLLLFHWLLSGAITIEQAAEQYRNLPKVDFSLADAEEGDVIYKIFQVADDAEGKIVTEENVRNLAHLNKSLPLVLLIHGWTTDDTSPWYQPLKDAFFDLGPHNVVYVNWSRAGNKSYRVSSANIKPVGKQMARFLIATGVPPENVHLIGHSLGSHLAGFTGKALLELAALKVGRITALDPAGPAFTAPQTAPDERLCTGDALFVDIVHTDVQLYGYTVPLGHVDFYPNGGRHQPGCPPRGEFENCSHARSTLYFIESLKIQSKAYEATFTEENYIVNIKVKPDAKEIVFGHHVDKGSRGVYYFKTHSEKPFLL